MQHVLVGPQPWPSHRGSSAYIEDIIHKSLTWRHASLTEVIIANKWRCGNGTWWVSTRTSAYIITSTHLSHLQMSKYAVMDFHESDSLHQHNIIVHRVSSVVKSQGYEACMDLTSILFPFLFWINNAWICTLRAAIIKFGATLTVHYPEKRSVCFLEIPKLIYYRLAYKCLW